MPRDAEDDALAVSGPAEDGGSSASQSPADDPRFPITANVSRRTLRGPKRISTVFGDAQVAAPQPERFRAAHLARRYGDVLLERVSFTRIRVDLAPAEAVLHPGLVVVRVDQGRARVVTPERSWSVGPGQSTVFHTSLDGAVDVETGSYRQAWIPLRAFQPMQYPRLQLALDQAISRSPLGDAVWAFVDALLDQPETVPALWNPTAAAPIERALADIVTQWMLQHADGAAGRDWSTPREPAPTDLPSEATDLRAACILFFQAKRGTRGLSVRDAAQELQVSARTLERAFAVVGTTPAAALRTARLESAARALRHRSSTPDLDSLAQEHGYTRDGLIRAFKAHFGATPLAYRRQSGRT